MFRPQVLAATVRLVPRASVARASLPAPVVAPRAFSSSSIDLAAPKKKRTKKTAAASEEPPKKTASASKKQATKEDKPDPPKKSEAKKSGSFKKASPKTPKPEPEPALPPADAPSDKKASTLSTASREHKDLAIDPDTVVLPNPEAAATTRDAAVEGLSFQPRHAGENPPGVPPQALKKAPETFNIQIPFPRREAPVVKPLIPVLHSASDVQPKDVKPVKPPPAVHAVADEERVHSPITSNLSAAEEKELENKYRVPQLAFLHQVGVPPAVLEHAVVFYDKASKNFYSLLPDGFAMAVDPIKDAQGKTEFRFHPGALPRQFNPEERKGLVVLTALLMLCLSASVLADMIALGQAQSAAARNAHAWEKEHPGEQPPEPFAAPKN